MLKQLKKKFVKSTIISIRKEEKHSDKPNMSSSIANSTKKLKNKPAGEQEKVRVLCLHGYRQNGDTFKSKIGSFRKHVSKYAEFVFITAPHQMVLHGSIESSANSDSTEDGSSDAKNRKNSDDNDGNDSDNQRSWWSNKNDGTFKGTNRSGPAFGFDESLRVVEEAWQQLGPFHGLLGFSQGASFVGLLCSLSIRGLTSIKPSFAIIAAGFRSGSLAHLNYYEETISIPSLHIYGEKDEIITTDMSELLATTFEDPKIVTHPGGHYFAASSSQKNIYIEFFQDRLVDYLENKELEKAQNDVTIFAKTSTNSHSSTDDSD